MNRADKIRIARTLKRLGIPDEDIALAVNDRPGKIRFWLSQYTYEDLDEDYPNDDEQCRWYHLHNAGNLPTALQAIEKDEGMDNSCDRLRRIGSARTKARHGEEEAEDEDMC
jgi:hypothetical protein